MRHSDHPINRNDTIRARTLRREASVHEDRLWFALKDAGKAYGVKFRRQQPIDIFVADFACMRAKLIIELDGQSHDLTGNKDAYRDARLKQCGCTTMRFANEDVKNDLDSVVDTIILYARKMISGEKLPPLPDVVNNF
ncbi:MAG: endonuclease domain-containing protein [Bdellovibrionales bacterium]